MRVIKFRAWNKVHKKMFEVYSIDFDNGLVHCRDARGGPGYTFGVIDIELRQGTGLQDKSGVDIYEGAIVEWSNSRLEVRWGAVGWVLKSPVFSRFGVSKEVAQCSEVNTLGYLNAAEVIGNIYENPELLGGES